MTEQSVIWSLRDGIADVRFNRAAKKNAMDFDTFSQLIDIAKEVSAEKSLRAVLLSGQGDCFCAGLDFSMFAIGQGAGDRSEQLLAPHESGRNKAQSAAMVWRDVPVPVIALLNGVVFGAGLQVAMAADIRIAHPDTKLSVMEMRWGIIPDMGVTQTLTRLVRDDIARELTYTGRILDAQEAHQLGLVTSISSDVMQSGLEMAETIATKNPDAIRSAKTLYNQSWAGQAETTYALEASLQKELLGRSNQIEAIMANLQKRKPQFSDPQ